jgi:hypothetical protein
MKSEERFRLEPQRCEEQNIQRTWESGKQESDNHFT